MKNRLSNNTKSYKIFKRAQALLLSFIMTISLIQVSTIVNNAAVQLIDWRKNDVMDVNLNVVINKAGAEDVFFEMDAKDAGLYELTYFLEDGRKTTVKFTNSYQKMDIQFKVQEDDSGTIIERTQDLVDLSYLEIDYSQQVPGWQFSADKEVDPVTNTLDFEIVRSASARFPGIAFQMDNKKFIAKWDFQADKLYVLFDGYEAGNIMPVKFVNPDLESQTIKVLKGLEDFTVLPTYLIQDPSNSGTNVEVSPVTSPNENKDKPGNRPGLRYNFKQPKELNDTTWQYEYESTDFENIRAIFEVDDIGSSSYLDFSMLLQNGSDKQINEIPSENGDQSIPKNQVNYKYDSATYEYEVIVVDDKSELANQDTIIQWNDLQSSRIYNTSIGFQFESMMPEYEFATFLPESNFAYTYLEYQLKRSDQQEAYIEIVPYEMGTQDEVEYVVLYSKIIAPELDPINDLWLKHYQGEAAGNNTINIPVPFRANSYQDAYQIIVNFSNTELKSQVLNYRAIDDLNVPPTTPKIQGLENLYVVPPEDAGSKNPTKIQFDLIWDALENRASGELDNIFTNDDENDKNDKIYYEVLVNDIPDINQENPFQVVRVYEVYQDLADGLYKVRVHGDATDEASSTSNYYNGYNEIDELFRMEKIAIYEDDTWAPRIDTVYNEDADTYTITERTSDSHPTSYQTDFEFPGVNYVRIRAITEKDGVLGISNYSVPVSLSLSMLKYDIPIVEGITYDPFYSLIKTEPMGVVMDWPAIDISNYEDNMLYPVDKSVTGVTYSVYLSEDKDALLHLKDVDDEYTQVSITPGGDLQIDDANLQLLRSEDSNGDGNVLFCDVDRIKNSTADISMRIEGLDLNNNYYARIVVKVDVNDIGGGPDEIRKGKPSSVLSITTPIVPPEPGDNEIIPLAPENFMIDFYDDNLLTTMLTWTIPDEITIEEDTFGFELLSIEDLRMPDQLATKGTDLLDIIENPALLDKTAEAWRILYEGADIVLKKYDVLTDTWVNQELSLLKVSDSGVRVIDDNNSPNRVNYYYVRTIHVKDGAEVNASNWMQGTITSAPVKGPINLIIDYDSAFDYRGKDETIIRFDAPVPNTADIEEDFVMEVFIKGEDDLDYIKATKTTSSTTKSDTYYVKYLSQSEGPIGYERLHYKVSGLIAGKQYYIKVRIEDRTKIQEELPDGSLSYPKSPFSERVSTRTEFSQEDYDKEIKYKQYIDYYLKKAEEIKQKPYFDLRSSDTISTAKYRQNYVDGLLQLSKNGNYKLVAYEKETSIYYLPAEMIKTGNDLNITYVIEPSGQQIALMPYSMGEVISKEINTVIDLINDYNATLEDYYIQIQLSVGDYSTTIYNKKPSSKLVHIQMNVIGSKEVEDDVDIYLENELDQAIIRGKDELIVELDKELDLGINDTKLTQIVQEVIVNVEKDFSRNGQMMFDGYLDSKSYPVIDLEKPLNIGLSPDDVDSSNTVYSRTTGDWKVESSLFYDNRYHISSNELGSFVSVNPIGSANLTNIYSSEQVNIMNKYGLADIFTTYELTHPEDTISNMQMIQTYARLVGANADTDTEDFLKGQGITVPYLSEFNLLNRETANYLYVQVYTKKHRMNLDAVIIRNYNAIEDIQSVNLGYRNTLLKGVSLGIIELEQNQLTPSKNVTVQEFFNIIENIE